MQDDKNHPRHVEVPMLSLSMNDPSTWANTYADARMHEEVEPRASTSCERVAEAIFSFPFFGGERMEADINE